MSSTPPLDHEDRPYRPGVGIVLFNRQGLVFLGERIDKPGAWQMPQGGIDEGEDLTAAVFREMEEEIGTRNARILAMVDEWLYYDIPPHTANKLWNAQWRGQKQKWIALEFLGEDAEIRLDLHSHPEFGQWKWLSWQEVARQAPVFKREVYERVLNDFSDLAEELAYNAGKQK